jgi:lysyl-tRNA synthetase class II
MVIVNADLNYPDEQRRRYEEQHRLATAGDEETQA